MSTQWEPKEKALRLDLYDPLIEHSYAMPSSSKRDERIEFKPIFIDSFTARSNYGLKCVKHDIFSKKKSLKKCYSFRKKVHFEENLTIQLRKAAIILKKNSKHNLVEI